MMHIAFIHFIFIQSVDSLYFGQRSQCRYITDLCLSSRKHSRTMYSRNRIYLSCQRTDLGNLTAVRTFMIFQDHLTYCLLFVLIDSLAQHCQPFFIFCKCLFQALGDLSDIFFPNLLLIRKYRFFHLLWRNKLFYLRKHIFRNCTARIFMLLFAHLGNNLIDKGNNRLIDVMGCVNRLNHLCFRDFIGSCFDHDDLFTGGGHSQLQISLFPLLLGRIDNQFSVNHTDLCHGTGTGKGNIRNACGNRSTQHRHQLRTALGIH